MTLSLIKYYATYSTWRHLFDMNLNFIGLSGDVEAADKAPVLRWRVGPQGEQVAVLWGGGGRVQVQRGLPRRATDKICRKEYWRVRLKALKKGQTREMLAQRLALHLEVELLRDAGDKLGIKRKNKTMEVADIRRYHFGWNVLQKGFDMTSQWWWLIRKLFRLWTCLTTLKSCMLVVDNTVDGKDN